MLGQLVPLWSVESAVDESSRRGVRTHTPRDLRSLSAARSVGTLTSLRTVPPSASDPAQRPADLKHTLKDIASLFSADTGVTGRHKRIRVCVVDTMLQTGGAEWFAAQLAMTSNPSIFEFIFVTYNSRNSLIAKHLIAKGFRVVCASSWRQGVIRYAEWVDHELFDVLERLNPDHVFFSSQYLFDQLPDDRLQRWSVVVRISNFHEDVLREADFSAARKVVCCTDEQYEVVSSRWPDKALMIKTGVNTDLFVPLDGPAQEALKRAHGLGGKSVVLFVGRLGSPLKRLDVFQEVVRRVKADRSDVAFVVVGYFSDHDGADELGFREFVEAEGVVWKTGVPPWEMPEWFQIADILLSTSDAYEGLSNTVLQALASAAVPVTTASAGMHELIDVGNTGFLAEDFDSASIARALEEALDAGSARRVNLSENGRRYVVERFSFRSCAEEYQRSLMQLYRAAPAHVCITDGSFGIGGAEWLAAQLMLTTDPNLVQFHLTVHRMGSALSGWLQHQGVHVHDAPPHVHYDMWRSEGLEQAFRLIRPDVVMPCTITTWPLHERFYRLLVISQNAADAKKLTAEDYDEADWILCVSQEVRDSLSSEHQWKMSVLRNSIDVEFFAPDDDSRRKVRESLGIGADVKVVLWAGRMHIPHKRLDLLMEIAHEMRNNPDVHFLVLGYFRPEEEEGQRVWLPFLEEHPNVSWVTGVTPWEMPRYYSAADVYLSTSGFQRGDFEGLSLTSAQALAAELPIVSTRSGGQEEVVDDGVNGRLVEVGDLHGLVSGVVEMTTLTAPRLARLRAANRAKARAQFDIREHARVYARMATLLKNTVGSALTTDSELPTADYGFREGTTEDEVRRASAFLHYTWPLVPVANERDGARVTELAPGDDPDRAATALEPGEWLVFKGLGPDFATRQRTEVQLFDASRICGLLDHLEYSFPIWSACERHRTDLLLKKW